MGRRVGQIGLIIMLSLAGAAAADAGIDFNGCRGCAFSFDPAGGDLATGIYYNDYTVPTDGRTHVLNLAFTHADATSTLFLGPPTEVDGFLGIRTATGVDTEYVVPGYVFDEQLVPGRSLRITAMAPRAFDDCTTQTGPVGQVCSAFYEVYGNGSQIVAGGDTVIRGVFSDSVVPEPATWTLLLSGFAMTGALLRRRTLAS